MAKTTATLNDIDTRHIQPIRPVQPTGFGEALETLGSLAVTGIQVGTTTALRSDMESLQNEYLQDKRDEQLSPQEIAETTDFARRLNKLQQASRQTGRTAEFKTRAEALLKERINAFPGLAAQYRQAASGVLGFDPTGEAARQLESQLEMQQKAAQKELQEMYDDAAQIAGLTRADLQDPKKQEFYLAMKTLQQENKRLEALDNNNKLAKSLGSDARHVVGVEEAAKSVQGQRLAVKATIDKALKEIGTITPEEIGYGLTPDTYAKAEPQFWDNLAQTLETEKRAYVAKTASLYSDLGDTTVRDIREMAASVYDEAIRAISAKESLTVYNQQTELYKNQLLGKAKEKNIEAFNNIMTLSGLGVGKELPIMNEWATALLSGQFNLNSVVDPTKPEADVEEIKKTNAAEINNISNYLVQVGQFLEKEAPDNAAKREDLSNVFYKLADGIAEANNEGGINKEVANAWLDVLANKENKKMLDQVRNDQPYLSQSMDAFMFGYMNNLTADTFKQVENILGKYRVRNVSSFGGRRGENTPPTKRISDIPLIKPVLDERGTLKFEIDEAAVKKYAPSLMQETTARIGGGALGLPSKTVTSPFMRDMNKLTSVLEKDLMKVIRATANSSGVTEKEAADLILRDLLPLGETTTTDEILPRR